MHQDTLREAAATLALARTGGQPIDSLPETLRPRDEAQAYALRQALHHHLTQAGHGPVAGHKIGCTTPVMQLSIP